MKLTPKNSKRGQIGKLKRDNVSLKNSWFMLDGSLILIRNQKIGEETTGRVELSKREFERFIKFYETGD